MIINSFEDIKAWQLARELTGLVYRLECKADYGFDIGFKSQIQRACVSIMSNIAEGFEYGNKPDLKRYLKIAKGSAGEVKSLLYLALDLKYVDSALFVELNEKVDGIMRLLGGFIRSLGR